MSDEQRAQQLKDRKDYRAALIHRQEATERKIAEVERQIQALKEAA